MSVCACPYAYAFMCVCLFELVYMLLYVYVYSVIDRIIYCSVDSRTHWTLLKLVDTITVARPLLDQHRQQEKNFLGEENS